MKPDLRLASTQQEIPLFFPARKEVLFGILTTPLAPPVGTAVVVLRGGSWEGTVSGRNRIFVRLCRRLAGHGYHALRFDYHGVGESTGRGTKFETDHPFHDDLEAAIDWLREQGIGRFVLVGECFGARTALAHATRLSGLEGLLLTSCPVRDFVREGRGAAPVVLERLRQPLRPRHLAGLFDGERRRMYMRILEARWRGIMTHGRTRLDPGSAQTFWVSRDFLEPLNSAVEDRTPILFLYGETDSEYEDFQRARSGPLRDMLQKAASLVEIKTLPGRVHTFPRLSVQDAALDIICEWLTRVRTSALLGSAGITGTRATPE